MGAWLSSCDNLTAGQLEDDSAAPVLLKILVQDEVTNTGRHLATDLLDKTPQIKCSEKDPCPAGDQYAHPPCVIPEGQTEGVCPNPLRATETPVQTGIPTNCGGVQIRLVFNKVLDPNTVEKAEKDDMTGAIKWTITPGILELDGPDGKELAFHDYLLTTPFVASKDARRCAKYYDPSGSPYLTADMFREPFGPALVLKPKDSLIVETEYTLKIDASKIKDKKGQSPSKDVNGPIQTAYKFTTESMAPIDGVFGPAGDATVAPTQALVLPTNAWFDPGTLDVKVVDGNGKEVKIVATPDLGGDPKKCAANENDQQLNIIPVMDDMTTTKWAAGTYKVTVNVASGDNPKAMLKTDTLGKTLFKDIPFTVKGSDTKAEDDPNHVDNFLLPAQCITPPPPDMAKPATGDMAMTPAGDMASVVDGGNGG